MNQKYVKPIARNLGDVLPNAKGVCNVGSWAGNNLCNQGSGDPADPQCRLGMLANGTCTNGYMALPNCNPGIGFPGVLCNAGAAPSAPFP
jgi:hypothetical protein